MLHSYCLSVALLFLIVNACVAQDLQQYTPDQANWSTLSSKPLASDTNAHDPDSVHWLSPESWVEAEWDGETIYNPSKMTKDDFWKAMCPHVDQIRGIREVFYEHNPFADNAAPTKAEVDEWHRIAINHVRALVGYTSEERQVKKDTCMFARSLWGQQRKRTTMWDDDYPEGNDIFGPCGSSDKAHCGASFIPSAEDQAPYLPDDHPACGTPGGSEGIFGGPKSNIVWSLKWSRAFCNTLKAEGFFGGHMGPFFRREKFGFSFWDTDLDENNSHAILRAKYTGKLFDHMYCNPDNDPDCDPEDTGPGSSLDPTSTNDGGSTDDGNGSTDDGNTTDDGNGSTDDDNATDDSNTPNDNGSSAGTIVPQTILFTFIVLILNQFFY
mmetsp:Transcript_15021/g.22497  ORF Transcript_15021/g.22497 Transcript_15021/m.22497 type:complete len:382 (+) Transcript_15021:93-1238(+)